MIVLPLTPDPVFTQAKVARKEEPPQRVFKLLVLGFSSAERKLLDGVVLLSRRRSPRIDLLSLDHADTADVILLDATNERAMQWATKQNNLHDRSVIWVGGHSALPGHLLVPRPVQWPVLPALLARAIDQKERATPVSG